MNDDLEEREYWYQALCEFYRSEYNLRPHPSQSDPAIVPPLEAVMQIQDASKATPDVFFATGYRTTLAYQTELRDYGQSPQRMQNILEMGVGLGRLIIHYFPFEARLCGCDVTPDAVNWTLAKHGHRVKVEITSFEPSLPYSDGLFDFVYAHSVFTHIPCNLVERWSAELNRIIRSGGFLIFTILDSNVYLRDVPQREFHARYLVPGCHDWDHEKGVLMLTYASRDFIHKTWGKYFQVLEIRSHHMDQSHVICQKRI